MRTIYKYHLRKDAPDQEISMHEGAEVLKAANQRENLVVWAVVDADRPKSPRRFLIAGTGHPLPEEDMGRHIGSAQFSGGAHVYHVFEPTDLN